MIDLITKVSSVLCYFWLVTSIVLVLGVFVGKIIKKSSEGGKDLIKKKRLVEMRPKRRRQDYDGIY